MKTMCPPGYHHNGFVATHALGHMMYGLIYIYIYLYIYIYIKYIIIYYINIYKCTILGLITPPPTDVNNVAKI